MDVGNRNAWRPEMVVPSRLSSPPASRARWPMHPVAENYRRPKWRSGLAVRRWPPAKWVFILGRCRSPFCGACSPPAAGLSSEGKVLHLPVRDPGASTCARALRARRETSRSSKNLIRGRWLGAYRPATANCVDELRRTEPQPKKIEMLLHRRFEP